MKVFNEFKVLNRQFIIGRGNVTVILNNDNIPIDTNSVIIQDSDLVPIIAVEKSMTLMTNPRPKPNWGIVTNEETVGETILIWNKGSEKNSDQNCGKNSNNLVIKL